MAPRVQPIDYLIIGHVTEDITPEGIVLGGTATYSGLTALAFGKKVGVLTSAGSETNLQPLEELQVHLVKSALSSTFQNIYEASGRRQLLTSRAEDLTIQALPREWSNARIRHCAPVANEVALDFCRTGSFQVLGLTPQGWLREWDDRGEISLRSWETIHSYLDPSAVVVLSLEDIGGALESAREIAGFCRILAVTMGAEGAMIYTGEEQRHIPAPRITEIDPTGCGDIFAATFFICLDAGNDPWFAASVANQLGANAASRKGLESIPTPAEIKNALLLRA